jgi:hypothetical protein
MPRAAPCSRETHAHTLGNCLFCSYWANISFHCIHGAQVSASADGLVEALDALVSAASTAATPTAPAHASGGGAAAAQQGLI